MICKIFPCLGGCADAESCGKSGAGTNRRNAPLVLPNKVRLMHRGRDAQRVQSHKQIICFASNYKFNMSLIIKKNQI
jgi:hypothetical protein